MIFLSYNWENKSTADQIDDWFVENNVEITRDTRDLKYKQSLKEFMRSIRNADYVIMIISEEFLKSNNCMFEVLEFVKDDTFKNRIIPIISDDRIFDINHKLDLVKFWKEKKENTEKSAKNLNAEALGPIYKDLKAMRQIENEILEFLEVICDMNNIVLHNNTFTDTDFDTITNHFGKDKFVQKDLILNCSLNIILKPSQILEFLKTIFEKIIVQHISEEGLSLRFNSYISAHEVERKLFEEYDKDNFKKLNIFTYTEAYYVVAKRKIDEYNSKVIMWWAHLGGGYTDNLKNAGYYNKKDIDGFAKHWFYDDQLAIKCNLVDLLNTNIFPLRSSYSEKLVENQKDIIGHVKYETENYFY